MKFNKPVSLEVGLVTDERHGSIITTQPLVFTDDVQISGSLVEAASTHDRVDDNERVRPLQVPLRLLIRLQYIHGDAEK